MSADDSAMVDNSEGKRSPVLELELEQYGFAAADLEEVDISEIVPDLPAIAGDMDNDAALQYALHLAAETPPLPNNNIPAFDENEWQRWINTDIPPDSVRPGELLPMVLATVDVGIEQASEYSGSAIDLPPATNTDQVDSRVSAALKSIGLELSGSFNLEEDSYALSTLSTDPQSQPGAIENAPALYLIPGVFTAPTATPDLTLAGAEEKQGGEQHQAMVVMLEEITGGGMQAMAVPVGALGTKEAALQNWETLRDTLYLTGPRSALDLISSLAVEQPMLAGTEIEAGNTGTDVEITSTLEQAEVPVSATTTTSVATDGITTPETGLDIDI